MKSHCQDKDHQAWPAHGRHTRHISVAATEDRGSVFERDLITSTTMKTPAQPERGAPRLQLIDGLKIDMDTGEVDG